MLQQLTKNIKLNNKFFDGEQPTTKNFNKWLSKVGDNFAGDSTKG